MEQPPNNSPSNLEPDLPKPPIWDRAASSVPPIDIPGIPGTAQPAATPPFASGVERVDLPIVPDVTQTMSHPIQPVLPQDPRPTFTPAPAPHLVPGSPAGAPIPTRAAGQSGPSLTDRRSFTTTPASGAGLSEKPQWPAAPPTAGHLTATGAVSPVPPAAPKPRRRVGLIAFAILLAATVAIAGFFFGRSVGTAESASTPIVAPAIVTPDIIAEPTPAATAVPTPTSVPPPPPVNDAPSPVLPGDGADEPVAAVALAVAPAVVLVENELGQGSGIIYDASGLILTNAHVVGQFTEVQITLASGVRVPGQVLGADQLTDVAVISIDTEFEFGVAVLAPEDSVQVGQLAVAIGSPFGLEQTVTSGIVSAKGRVLQNPTVDGRLSVVAMIQTDAPINPGNSGGALADRQGRVIGMNTSIRTDGSGGNIGVGFAVPAETAKLIADRIIAGESLEQGFLGINGGTPLVGEPGVIVGDVTPGSGADIAGLLAGDRIVGFNEMEIKGMTDLAAAVRLQPPEATVPIEFVRDGTTMVVDVTLGLLIAQ